MQTSPVVTRKIKIKFKIKIKLQQTTYKLATALITCYFKYTAIKHN